MVRILGTASFPVLAFCSLLSGLFKLKPLSVDERVTNESFYREMMVVVYGFPTKKEALAFEWNWQKPFTSKLLRQISNDLVAQKTMGNRWKLKFKMRIMFEMLQLSPWNRFPLTLHWLGRSPLDHPDLFPPLPDLPSHMRQVYAPIAELDMLLRGVVDEEQEGLASGEEEHSDEDDLRVLENDPRALVYNTLPSVTTRFGDEVEEDDEFGGLSSTQPPARANPRPTVPSLANLRASSNAGPSSNGSGPGAPRRSISASSILPVPPLTTDALDFHNRSIDEDDDSFLHIPAFAPRTQAPAKTVSAKASSAARAPQPRPAETSAMQVDEPPSLPSTARDNRDATSVHGAVKCHICSSGIQKIEHGICCAKEECQEAYHIVCLATRALQEEGGHDEGGKVKYLIPINATCPRCHYKNRWMDLIRHKQRWMNHPTNPLRPLINTSTSAPIDLASFRR